METHTKFHKILEILGNPKEFRGNPALGSPLFSPSLVVLLLLLPLQPTVPSACAHACVCARPKTFPKPDPKTFPKPSQNRLRIHGNVCQNQTTCCLHFEWTVGVSWGQDGAKKFQKGTRKVVTFGTVFGLGGVWGGLGPFWGPRHDFNIFLMIFNRLWLTFGQFFLIIFVPLLP